MCLRLGGLQNMKKINLLKSNGFRGLKVLKVYQFPVKHKKVFHIDYHFMPRNPLTQSFSHLKALRPVL